MCEELNKKDEYWREAVAELAADTTHGSLFLANQALDIIEDYIRQQLYRNRTELIQNLSKLSNALVRAKPLMALIYTRAEHILEFIQAIPKEERNIEIIREKTLDEITNLRRQAEENSKAVTKFGARLILDQHIVLTHSASAAVEAVLLEARRQKKRFRVICTESRPGMEGKMLAERLAKAGIKTRLIPDADITRAVANAHFVLSGCDRITENTFVNKTGTAAINTLALHQSKPFYLVAETGKILLKRTYPVRFQSQNEHELFKNPPDNLTVSNIYFEEVPITDIHKVICEKGIFELPEFMDRYL
ncbi:MAG: initiation factor 2B [Calditrichia bacterium]